jgi:ribose/xylose/arabinose/galactoside ABC-type transport system permease subunit
LNNLIWVLLIATIVIFQLLTPRFLSQRNLLNILEHASVLGIMVIGQSFALLSGNFDLSAESVLGLTALMGAWLVTAAASPSNGSGLMLNPFLTVVIMFAIGGAIGILNGYLITRLKMNNFIVTLALMIILRGVVMVINQGVTISKINPAFTALGRWAMINFSVSLSRSSSCCRSLSLPICSHAIPNWAETCMRWAAIATPPRPPVSIRERGSARSISSAG